MKIHSENSGHKQQPNRRARLVQAFVVALLMAMAIPALAEERAIVNRVAPVYPEMAKRMRIAGTVKLSVTVDAEGKVTASKPISGNGMLATAAEEAVKRWKFESGSGATTQEVSLNFSL